MMMGSGGHARALSSFTKLDANEWALGFGALNPHDLEERYKQYNPEKNFPVLRHPKAIVELSMIGEGTHIMAGAFIGAHAIIGNCCIINTGAIIEHDAELGNGCHIAPGAVVLGGAILNDFCFVGANAVVVQGSVVPPRTFIKAGSVWKS